MKKLIIFCVIAILTSAAGAGGTNKVSKQSYLTNAPPEPFSWLASASYTERFVKTFNDFRAISTDPSIRGKVVQISTSDGWLQGNQICDRVYYCNGGFIAAENYPKVSKMPPPRYGSASAKKYYYYVYVADDELCERIANDMASIGKKEFSNKSMPFMIILGTKTKTSFGKATYSW